MRIAHIAPPWITIPPKNYGGTELTIYNLVEEQVACGHDVTLFAPADAKTSATLVSFLARSLMEESIPWTSHFKAYYHLYKSLQHAKGFDIIHTHLSCPSDLYIFPLASHITTPHVTTLESPLPLDRTGSGTNEADRLFIEFAPSLPIVAVSQNARKNIPYNLNCIGVVYPGLPLKEFYASKQVRDNYFVWLGRFSPDKGPHLAIKAAQEAAVPIVLAGTIDRSMPEDVDYFEHKIKPQIDNVQVRYIGPVNLQQKNDLLSSARGLLNPIQWEEPFGLVMIEAMALGCPVIAFARGAAPEVIVHSDTGFLAHNIEEMIHFIARVDEIDPRRVRMHIENHFSVSIMSQKYVEIYKKVIGDYSNLASPYLRYC
jgi:glycosyltransferase involved in cell wall biosynthesis